MDRITLMLMVSDSARADIVLTPARTYYRFATESSLEDGELAPVAAFEAVAARIAEAAAPRDGESPLPADVRMQLFVDNCIVPGTRTEQALRRTVDAVAALYPEFAFVEGFRC